MNEKNIILDFSAKSCQKGCFYQILFQSEDKYINMNNSFKTEELKCSVENGEIFFTEKLPLCFHFKKKQEVLIIFLKKIPIANSNNYITEQVKRKTYLPSIISSVDSSYERCLNQKTKNKDIFCVKANKYTQNNKNDDEKVFEFFKSGIKLNNFIAIDFSNNKNKQKREKSLTQYSDIIQVIKERTYFYVNNRLTYLYGFGGKLINENEEFNDIFNLNMENDAPIELDKILDVYKASLNKITPNKTITLSKLIRNITKKIYSLFETREYNILFIILRELPDESDKQELIDAIIESSYLPLTIIVIGEGKNDFYKLKHFFKEQINETKIGIKKTRNNILSKYYSDFDEKGPILMNWCLEEISKHIIEFYNLINCTPEQINKNNTHSIKQSFNQYNQKSICIYQSYINHNSNNMNNSLQSIIEEKKEYEEKEDKKDGEENKKEKEDKKEGEENKKEKEDKKEKDKEEKKEENKYTPGGSINPDITNIINPYAPKNKDTSQSNKIENKDKNLGIYKITPGQSIWTLNPDNPYNPENKSPKKFTINSESIINPVIKIDNPYNPNIKKEKNESESKIDFNYISTKDSGQISNDASVKIKNSDFYKFNYNYSIDNY